MMAHARRHTHTHLPCVMGCSKSKEQRQKERSPKVVEKKEAWEAMLTKGLGLSQLDSNIKRLDTGYIASIFSANYATALRRAPLRTKIDMDDILLPVTEGSTPPKLSEFTLAHGRARRSSSSDMTFMQPLPSNEGKEASTGKNKGVGADVKALNSLEITRDPEYGNGAFSKVESTSKMHPEAASLIDPLVASSQATAQQPVTMLKKAITFPRAKYLTFMDNTEDVDALMVASKSSAFPMEEDVCLGRDSANDVVEPNLKFLSHTHIGGVPVESSGVNTYRHRSDELEPVPLREGTLDAEIAHPRGRTSSENPRNLQKTLSMKYILNANTIEDEDSHMLTDNYAPSSQPSMLHGRLYDEDDTEVTFLYESNSSSCASSPEFSSAASLKDWLPREDPPLMLAVDFYQARKETPMFDAFQASHTLLRPDLLPSTKGVLLKYVGGDFGHTLDDATQDVLQSPSEGAVTSSLMGTLGRATRQQPTEESCASKTMKAAAIPLNGEKDTIQGSSGKSHSWENHTVGIREGRQGGECPQGLVAGFGTQNEEHIGWSFDESGRDGEEMGTSCLYHEIPSFVSQSPLRFSFRCLPNEMCIDRQHEEVVIGSCSV